MRTLKDLDRPGTCIILVLNDLERSFGRPDSSVSKTSWERFGGIRGNVMFLLVMSLDGVSIAGGIINLVFWYDRMKTVASSLIILRVVIDLSL
jgi:hypothetical protein